MKTFAIRDCENARLCGRDDRTLPGFPLYWSLSSVELLTKASCLEIELECDYEFYRPYVSFEVDGLRAQTFSPLKGKHWYCVFLLMDAKQAHAVRVLKETQPFSGDPKGLITVTRVRTDGELLPMNARKKRFLFIGDSITSGEGVRGPKSFMEWLPMTFGASDTYPRLVGDAMNADIETLSQSGWGTVCAWNNNRSQNLPSIFDSVCAPLGNARAADFSVSPNAVFVALGANDCSALSQPPFTDPVTGESFKLTDSPEDRKLVENTAFAFLEHLRDTYPSSRLVWVSFMESGSVPDAIRRGVSRANAEFLVPLTLDRLPRGGIGSRSHPGPVAHRKIAKEIVRFLKSPR